MRENEFGSQKGCECRSALPCWNTSWAITNGPLVIAQALRTDTKV